MILAILLALAAPAQAAGAGSVTLHYLGHSCFVVTTPGGTRLLIDPFASGEWPGLAFPVVHADRVLVTHPHWDHSAWRAVRGDPKLIDGPGPVQGDDFRVEGIPGRHAEAGGAAIGYRNLIFVIQTAGVRIVHLGDNGPPTDPLRQAIGAADVLLIPVDGERRVLTFEQAGAWIEALSPRLVIPMHYRVEGLSLDRVTGLGAVGPWLAGLSSWRRLDGDRRVLDAASLPAAGAREVEVFTLPGEKPGALSPAGPAGDPRAREAARRGETAAAEGDLSAALAEFSRAAELDPSDAEVLLKLGLLHLGSQRPDRAAEILPRAAALAGTKAPRIASLAWLGAGMAWDSLGRREEALAAYRRVVEIGSNEENQVDQARRYLERPYASD